MLLFFSILNMFFSHINDHKFYVTTTNIVYKKEANTLQITSRLFIDDIEFLLQQDSPQLKLDPDSENLLIDELIEKVLNKTFHIKVDQEWLNYSFVGREYKNDIIQCYMEVELPNTPEIISIKSTIFFNVFKNQQNIIHFKNGSDRKSFLLHSSKNMVQFCLD